MGVLGQVDRTTSASTLFHKTIGFNRLARKIAIANPTHFDGKYGRRSCKFRTVCKPKQFFSVHVRALAKLCSC